MIGTEIPRFASIQAAMSWIIDTGCYQYSVTERRWRDEYSFLRINDFGTFAVVIECR